MKVVITNTRDNSSETLGGSEKNNFINLKYLDPAMIESNTQDVDIILYTKERKKLFRYYIDGKYFNSRSQIDFSVLSPSYGAPKVAKAFKHLIKMCGGSSELF